MYAVNGMMCDGCVAKVKNALKNIPEVIETQVHLSEPQVILSMKEDIPFEKLRRIISDSGHYVLSEIEENKANSLSKEPQRKLGKMLGMFHHKKDCCK